MPADGELKFKRDGTLVSQETVTRNIEELAGISWGPNSNMKSSFGLTDFKYLSDAGLGVTVYVFDTGITLANPVSASRLC